jgi:acetyl esterase/lipase
MVVPRRSVALALALAVAIAIASCGGGPSPISSSPPPAVRTAAYLPGLEADLRFPEAPDPRTPVVVLVPGGGWQTADRRGLTPLAERLTAWGAVTANITQRAGEDGVTFPVPVADVLCATAYAARQAAEAGAGGPVVLVGHSSGAHLAMLAALAPGHFADPSCPYPLVEPDAVAGLAGIYDLTDAVDVAVALLGAPPEEAPDRWAEAGATTWVAERPSLPVLLAHGDRDPLVPRSLTEDFADRLTATGHPVTLRIVAGADHHALYAPDVIGPVLEPWLAALSG